MNTSDLLQLGREEAEDSYLKSCPIIYQIEDR